MENDVYVLDYWRLLNGKYIEKPKEDDGLDCDIGIENTLP